MKKIKFLTMSLLALLMACFTACENKYNVDHTAELVGTWTCLRPGYAEALVIKADGSVLSTGCDGEDYWENVVGNIVIKNNVATMIFEDGDNFKGHFDLVPGVAFTIYAEDGNHLTFNLCEEDLSDEIVGMWIFQDIEDAAIQTFTEDGKLITTASISDLYAFNVVQQVSEYKVVGDLRFHLFLEETINHDRCLPARLVYTPKANAYGDIMSTTFYVPTDNGWVETTSTMLRVKETLNPTEKKYAYSSAYVTNAKGKDEDFTILGHTFNMTKIEGGDFDVIFGADLYCMELNANSITHKFRPNGQYVEVVTPITVDGNKVTLDMSPINPACRTVEMYMFQDADDSQLHIYMHTKAFINYFVNLEIPTLVAEGKLDPTDAAAVAKVFTDMEARVESINVSMVFKARN